MPRLSPAWVTCGCSNPTSAQLSAYSNRPWEQNGARDAALDSAFESAQLQYANLLLKPPIDSDQAAGLFM